jgi:hypothetical protein
MPRPLRQERYCSSEEFNRGLMANLVARRCAVLERAEDRELILFLQYLSHKAGGLAAVAKDLLAKYPDRIQTPAMVEIGTKPGRNYNADRVRKIRGDLPWEEAAQFPLKGDRFGDDYSAEALLDVINDRHPAIDHDSPSSYPASKFVELCRSKADSELENHLREICLNPASRLDAGPWYFPGLIDCLREFQTQWIANRQQQTVTTELGAQVYDTLDYSLQSRRLVLIEGLARMGKTFAAQAWCEQHPGRARYVQVASTNDEIGFYRAVAKALGASINLNSKAQELRLRIEETLQAGHLAIVFDEAHYLWPNLIDARSLPSRMNWIMTALVNAGVPVAMISTPQFLKNQKAMETRTRWASEQFIGRIGHYQKLPDSLSENDLTKVAKALLPEGDAKAIETLVRYAQGSAKYLAGIESAVCRARYLASKDGRERVSFGDVKRAIKESVIPSDSALARALAEPPKGGRRIVLMPVEVPLTPDLKPALEQSGPRRMTDFSHRRFAGDSTRQLQPVTAPANPGD